VDHEAIITIFGSPNQTLVARDKQGHINLNGLWCGGAATVTNTDVVAVSGDSGLQTLDIDLAHGGFKPGFTNEAGTSDEIEFDVQLGLGYDVFYILGSKAADKVDFGQQTVLTFTTYHVNLNSSETTGIDSDVDVQSVEVFGIDSKGGNDRVRAQGKAGTGPDPFALSLEVFAGGGNDVVKGGEATDSIYGGLGVDVLYGKGGDDHFYVGDGVDGDVTYGGPGDDQCLTWDAGDICNE
jgi:hypothetical protein